MKDKKVKWQANLPLLLPMLLGLLVWFPIAMVAVGTGQFVEFMSSNKGM